MGGGGVFSFFMHLINLNIVLCHFPSSGEVRVINPPIDASELGACEPFPGNNFLRLLLEPHTYRYVSVHKKGFKHIVRSRGVQEGR